MSELIIQISELRKRRKKKTKDNKNFCGRAIKHASMRQVSNTYIGVYIFLNKNLKKKNPNKRKSIRVFFPLTGIIPFHPFLLMVSETIHSTSAIFLFKKSYICKTFPLIFF